MIPDGSASLSGDGKPLHFLWEQAGGPAENTVQGHAMASLALRGLVPGRYQCRLTVNDDRGASDTDGVSVTVRRSLS